MIPMLLGTSDRQLYAIYHPAAGSGRTSRGFVLCNPEPTEAVRANRAYRALANALVRKRGHVIRFDYYGTGNSGGNASDLTVESQSADIATAIDALKWLSGISTVTLVGLRAGAQAAAVCADKRPDVQRIIAWDPVSPELRGLITNSLAKWLWLTTTLEDPPNDSSSAHSTSGAVESRTVNAPPAWLEEQTFGSGPIPSSAISAITNWS